MPSDGVSEAFSAAVELAYAQGRAKWPAVDLALEAFAEHAQHCLRDELDPASALKTLSTQDLYLACACLQRDASALSRFDDMLQRVLSRTVSPERADEVGQRVRSKLLVGNEPKIARYRGQGTLENWTRVIVARAEVDAIRSQRPHNQAVEITSWSEAAHDETAGDPELEHFKQRYRAEFAEAFALALGELSSHHRNVLRQQILFGHKLVEIAALHGVSDRTVKRWLAAAREALRASTRDVLVGRLKLGPGEFTSIVRLIDSQMDAIALPLLRQRSQGEDEAS